MSCGVLLARGGGATADPDVQGCNEAMAGLHAASTRSEGYTRAATPAPSRNVSVDTPLQFHTGSDPDRDAPWPACVVPVAPFSLTSGVPGARGVFDVSGLAGVAVESGISVGTALAHLARGLQKAHRFQRIVFWLRQDTPRGSARASRPSSSNRGRTSRSNLFC